MNVFTNSNEIHLVWLGASTSLVEDSCFWLLAQLQLQLDRNHRRAAACTCGGKQLQLQARVIRIPGRGSAATPARMILTYVTLSRGSQIRLMSLHIFPTT